MLRFACYELIMHMDSDCMLKLKVMMRKLRAKLWNLASVFGFTSLQMLTVCRSMDVNRLITISFMANGRQSMWINRV
jgi:hypothetical protein